MAQDIGNGHLLIVGHGTAATVVATRIRQENTACRITIVGREPYPYYDRRRLYEVARGECEVEDLITHPAEYYHNMNIVLRLNQRVARIDRERGAGVLSSGETIPFDKLLIANGDLAKTAGVIGSGLEGIFTLRDAQDAIGVFRYSRSTKIRNLVVIGGGTIGVEFALNYQDIEGKVFLVEKQERLLKSLLDEESSKMVTSRLESAGVIVRCDDEPTSFSGSGRVETVELKSGQSLPADMVMVCIGTYPHPDLFRDDHFKSPFGIPVNSRTQTIDPDIYAIGTAAYFPSLTGGGHTIGRLTGDIAARNILGDRATLPVNQLVQPYFLRLGGLKIISLASASNVGTKSITRNEISNTVWWRIYVDNDRPSGGVFVNSPQIGNLLVGALTQGQAMSEFISEVKASGSV